MAKPLVPAAGRLLVARPTMGDPRFHRTVILLLEHDDDGTLGVVLNRPSETDVGEEMPEWVSAAAPPDRFFVGGPVEPQAVMAVGRLASTDVEWDPASRLVGDVVLINMAKGPHGPEVLAGHRLFVGYAGWGPGQLDGELGADGWWVVASEPDDLLASDPDGLWSAVLARQGGALATVANYPEDVSLN